jgi:hypothetical protein
MERKSLDGSLIHRGGFPNFAGVAIALYPFRTTRLHAQVYNVHRFDAL